MCDFIRVQKKTRKKVQSAMRFIYSSLTPIVILVVIPVIVIYLTYVVELPALFTIRGSPVTTGYGYVIVGNGSNTFMPNETIIYDTLQIHFLR